MLFKILLTTVKQKNSTVSLTQLQRTLQATEVYSDIPLKGEDFQVLSDNPQHSHNRKLRNEVNSDSTFLPSYQDTFHFS